MKKESSVKVILTQFLGSFSNCHVLAVKCLEKQKKKSVFALLSPLVLFYFVSTMM